jgi:transposase-like protein
VKKRGPKAYNEEFRREAVRLADSGTRPMAQIARDRDSSRNSPLRAPTGAARDGRRTDGGHRTVARGRISAVAARERPAAGGE